MTSISDRRRQFLALLNDNHEQRPRIAPGAYDALSARLIQQAGFDMVYIGSYGTASSMGLPDVGLLSIDELTASIRTVVDAVDIPVLADAENGFHNAANIWRTVRAYEATGVCAMHIDDHDSGKHSDLARRVAPLDLTLHKLRAALAARQDPDFSIIARTDASWASGNPEDAVLRMQAFAAAGADVVMATGLTAAQLAPVRDWIAAKVVLVNTPPETIAQEHVAGADLVIYHSLCLYAATKGVTTALAQFRQAADLSAAANAMQSADQVEALLDYEGFNQRGRRHGMA